MKWIIWCLFLIVLVELHDPGCFACPEEERLALLDLRAFFYPDESSAPPSWGSEESDCCRWENVVCDNRTQHVSKLFLNSTWNAYYNGDLYLNVSLFLPFEQLVFLNLSSNEMTAPGDGFERLSNLNKLEFLDLSGNAFNDSILAFVGSLSSLRTLSLGSNIIQGSSHFQELAALHKLEQLDLSNNELESFFTTSGLKNLSKLKVLNLNFNWFNTSILSSLSTLPSLKELYLNNNKLEGSIGTEVIQGLRGLEVLDISTNNLSMKILQDVGVMESLKALSLQDNGFNGSLQAEGLCKLKTLEELDLSDNHFVGAVPSCLGDLTSLRVLDLSKNKFSGTISSSFLSSLASLEFLSLSHNVFESLAPFSSFGTHSKLEVFELVSDNNGLVVETDNPVWVPSFQLKVFRLSNCIIKGSILSLLSYQYDLRVVDLSHNNLTGEIPVWLMENNTRLEELHLKNNSFTGQWHVPSHPHSSISFLDVSGNQFQGLLPSNMSISLPNLKFLNASKNSFGGSIPSSFGNMRELILLDLSNNSFTGAIPQDLTLGCFSLQVLKLSNNELDGQMFPRLSNLTSLTFLLLDGNHFLGEIPDGLSNSSRLVRLDISYNFISGNLPTWIGNMTSLDTLFMPKNRLKGSIPSEFCALDELKVLDLSQNNLSGSIPSCFGTYSLQHLRLHGNTFKGPLPKSLSESTNLVTLDIRNNRLNGGIPNWISQLSSLSILLLRGNHLEGKIPAQLCQLSMMTLLDLSNNNLSGSIPSCLNKIRFKIGFRYGKFGITPSPFDATKFSSYSYKTQYIEVSQDSVNAYPVTSDKSMAEFTTKNRSELYRGNFLYLMNGIDLSANKLTGRIPPEVGMLGGIHSLNLSHNALTGPIPTTFSGLSKVESLDLSYNNLSGPIPSELTKLTTLAVFSVAYNNLSGETPGRKAQFGTFSQNSYEGNPFLCGFPLNQTCVSNGDKEEPKTSNASEENESSFIDMLVFYISFGVSYVTVLLVLAATLFINKDWRSKWSHFIDACIASCCKCILCCFCKFTSKRGSE